MLIANTDIEAKQLINLYDADPARVEVVHPGVDLDVFRPVPSSRAARLGLPAGRRRADVRRPDPAAQGARRAAPRGRRAARAGPALRSRLVVPVVGGPSGSGLEHPESLAQLADARHRRRGAVRAAGRAGGARRLVRRGDAGVRAVLQRVLRAGRRGGAGRRHAGRRGRRRGADHRRRGTAARAAGRGARPGRLRRGRWSGSSTTPALRAELSRGAVAQAAQFAWERTADRTVEVYGRAQSMREDLAEWPRDPARARARQVVRGHARSESDLDWHGDPRGRLQRGAARREEARRPRCGSTSAGTRSGCTRSSAGTPTRTTSGSTAGCSSAT